MVDSLEETKTSVLAVGEGDERDLLRVFHVAQPTTEGVARCVADFAKAQVAAGHEVTVCCPAGGDLPGWALGAGAAFEPWAASRSPGPQVMAESKRLRLLLEGLGALGPGPTRPRSIVHLHSAKAGLVGRLVIRGRRPTIFQPHAWSWLAASGPVRAGARNWERRAARWADRVVCVSEEEVRIGRGENVSARYEVVPNGVDLADYPFAGDAEKKAARARLGIPSGPVAVCVGRLSRQKGQDVLLEAWTEVRRSLPEAALYLVGDGPDRRTLEEAAGENVTFMGTRSDAGDWLAAADVVALPSRWEGMSIVMLEAMATGRPLVASDVAGVAEALSDEAGEVVAPENAPVLATALLKRLTDPERTRREGLNARRRAEESHSVQAATASLERIYREVLAERSL